MWILAGKPKPVFDDRTIQNLIDACAAIDQLTTEATISFRPESYTLTYTNGRDIYINDLKIKSTNVVSGATTFLDEIFDNKNILFIPNLGSPHRSIHALINDIGVKGETKKMFFPKSDKTQVLFRPTISRKEIIREKINTDELDKRFRENSKS